MPRKKAYRKKVTNQATSISDTKQYVSDSDAWTQLPRNTFKHFGFFDLAKYQPISLETEKTFSHMDTKVFSELVKNRDCF